MTHKRLFSLFALLAIIFTLSSCAGNDNSGFTATFLNVGKADASVFICNNSTVVIDTGETLGGDRVVNYLKSLGITTVDYLIITHYDADHVGGAATVVERMDIKNVITTGYIKQSKELDKFESALELKGLERNVPDRPLTFNAGDASFCVYPPEKDKYIDDNSNNSSLVINITYGENDFLVTGDAKYERIEEVLTYGIKDIDVLKMPYHGNFGDNYGLLVEMTRPVYTVITDSNDFKADNRTIEMLKQSGTEIVYTRNGKITFRSDKTSITKS